MPLTDHINFLGATLVLQWMCYHYILRFIFSYVQPIFSPSPLSFSFSCLCLFYLGLNLYYTPTFLLKIFCLLIICCHLVTYYYDSGKILSDASQHFYLPDFPKFLWSTKERHLQCFKTPMLPLYENLGCWWKFIPINCYKIFSYLCLLYCDFTSCRYLDKVVHYGG